MELKRLFEKGKIWTFSNFLSVLRIPLAIVFYFLIMQKNVTWAVIVAIIGILSDYADGYFARKRNEITELGKVLDPAADKFAIALGSISLYLKFGLPLWVVLVIIGRDVLIIIGSLLLVKKVERVVPSELPGKIAVAVISLLLISYLFEFNEVHLLLLIITLIAVIVSFIFYLIKFIRMLLSDSDNGEC